MFANVGHWLRRRDKDLGRPRKRALLAWEFGAGRTHAYNLLGVAAHLRAAGIECLATLYDTAFDREFAALGIPTVQNYVWPGWRQAGAAHPARPPRNMTDVLANYGLADAEAVAAALAHYDGLFTLFNPDVVLCDHAFAGLLAARGRVPGVAIGSPVLLPPPVDGGFPCLEEDAHPAWAADEILEGLNRGLTRAGRFPLESITDLLRVDGIFPFGPRAFDPYANLRSEPVLAPYIHGLRLPRRESKAPLGPAHAPESATRQEVFVYLHGFVQHREPIMEGLLAIKHPVRAFIPGLTAENERRLEARGILVESAPVAIDDIVARSRCLVHHGGPNLTVLGLAAGLPQVILAKEFDNRTSAVFVEQRGLGFGTILGQASSGYLAAAVHRAHSDEALRHACIAAAPAFREWLYPDPTAFVAQAICALVDASPPPTVLSDPEP